MDSMVNRYTSDRRVRSDDAYTPEGIGGKRPDRSVIVYAQRAREAFKDVPIVVGGIEALGLFAGHFHFRGMLWDTVRKLNDNFGTLGYFIIGFFVLSWILSIALYKWQRLDELELEA